MTETEIFGKLVVENSVMTGCHYCKGKNTMSLVSEVMTIPMFEQFKADQDSTNCELNQQIETTETKLQQTLDVDRTVVKDIWEECKILNANVKTSFTEWEETACIENVRYWSFISGCAVSYPERSDTLYLVRPLASFRFSCAEVHALVLRVWPDKLLQMGYAVTLRLPGHTKEVPGYLHMV